MADDERRAITIKKAAELASVSRRTIYNWINAGKLEVVFVPSGKRRVYLDSLFRHAKT